MGIDPATIKLVSLMPCTAKKAEARRPEMSNSIGLDTEPVFDTDFVLTTRELGKLLRLNKLHPGAFKGQPADHPLGEASGAGVVFGNSGGVMEASLRTAYELVSKKSLPRLEFDEVRGLHKGLRMAKVELPMPQVDDSDQQKNTMTLNVGVVHSAAQIRRLLDRLKNIRASEPDPDDIVNNLHFLEVMACRGGCIGGGGQPKSEDPFIIPSRAARVYSEDEKSAVRKSHENPSIKQAYVEFLGEPLGAKSRELLHTRYRDRRYTPRDGPTESKQ